MRCHALSHFNYQVGRSYTRRFAVSVAVFPAKKHAPPLAGSPPRTDGGAVEPPALTKNIIEHINFQLCLVVFWRTTAAGHLLFCVLSWAPTRTNGTDNVLLIALLRTTAKRVQR